MIDTIGIDMLITMAAAAGVFATVLGAGLWIVFVFEQGEAVAAVQAVVDPE